MPAGESIEPMSDHDQRGKVLDFLRGQFLRVHAKLDLLLADMGNLKVRVSGLEAEAGHVRVGLAEVNSRIDRLETRLERIERRLDLVEGPAWNALSASPEARGLSR